MQLLKPLFVIATAGFVAACTGAPNGSEGFPTIGAGGNASVTVTDTALAPLLDSATMDDGVLAYSYFTDVVSDGRVLTGADSYCGGTGQAVITLNKGTKGGRAYHTMLITCR